MPKAPRNLSGRQLGQALGKLGYRIVRQTGSHMRYCTEQGGVHCVTIVDERPLNVKTLGRILKEVAGHCGLSRGDLTQLLFP